MSDAVPVWHSDIRIDVLTTVCVMLCVMFKVGIPNFVSGPREYIMEGEYVILAMCSWFRIR